MQRVVCLLTIAGSMALWTADSPGAELTVERDGQTVVVKVDGQLFTRYIPDFNGTPILWPVIGPTGTPVTRAYPMGRGKGEREDHPHHRSVWFTHGDVNGYSFWHRETIKHRRYVTVSGGREAVIVTENDWLTPEGQRVCEDQRRLVFGADGQRRWIDYDVTIKAGDGPVVFGDTKEGTMAVRVAATIKVDAGLGGEIVNSEGLRDRDAWGKRAAWVDYHGPVDGQTVGIAILNHPSSFRFPTYWHVRTYGLFAANPFGMHDFLRNPQADGSHRLAKGDSLVLRYRILLHKGDEKEGRVAEAFAAYARQPR